jgi:hypothetical protein
MVMAKKPENIGFFPYAKRSVSFVLPTMPSLPWQTAASRSAPARQSVQRQLPPLHP